MFDPIFAIATENEVEAVDLADMVAAQRGADMARLKMQAGALWPDGIHEGRLPFALFLGLTRSNPQFEAFRYWARSNSVQVILIDGPQGSQPDAAVLTRPFTDEDVAKILDAL
ncbi:hypothetical protein [Pseudaestuariivita atlantica]|uniref:Uncharacterized protein n=1 Tax=Pseudaestuariivita atlantica TaxID=1317121 RepID=A0A0L1JNA3_9RHOB|nr:hypothetical protein [Pseudaestuariivita atlantica]KNG93234.1 hypothetical protein ATO11_12310 [Pseudaestuariivita atlantica]